MRHVFVETNWVFAYAAPAHHKKLDAVELLKRANADEIQLHLPSFCLSEARLAITRKCRPRTEADAIRLFLSRARAEKNVRPEEEVAVLSVLDRFEQQVRGELRQLDDVLRSLRTVDGIEVFPLNELMLEQALDLAQTGLWLKPFDQAILAGVLGRAQDLRKQGETDLCFCVVDGDLQPWGRLGDSKPLLKKLYDEARIWVYGDFSMKEPERPVDWAF